MGSAFGAIGSIGGALIGLSDESTKHTVERIEDALALRELKPVTFYKEEYSMNPERMHHGFIAQDYGKVMPDATYDEELGKMCIDTSELISLLVRSVQQRNPYCTDGSSPRISRSLVMALMPEGYISSSCLSALFPTARPGAGMLNAVGDVASTGLNLTPSMQTQVAQRNAVGKGAELFKS